MSTLSSSDSDVLRPMLRLALPVLAEEFLNLFVGYTDWWLTARFLPGVETKAAMGLMAYVLWLLPALFSAVAIGATAMTARFIGAGDRKMASRVTHQSLLLGGWIAIAATVGLYLLAAPFIRTMQLHGMAADLAVRYLRILAPVIPLLMIEQVSLACLHGAGDTVSGFLAKILVNVVNMGLSTSLVLGLGPFPKLGWEGLAIGTAAGHAAGGLILLVMLLQGRAGLRVRWHDLRWDAELTKRLLSTGIPGGVDVLSILTCHLGYVSIINSLGAEAAAAHGLGIQIEALSYLPSSAFQVAAGTLAGQSLGARDPRRATHSVAVTCLFGVSIIVGVALIFFFGGGGLASLFTGDPADPTTLQTARLLKIVAWSTPPLAVLMILNGALRGAGDTRVTMLVTFVGLLGIRLPGACLLAWSEVPLPGTGYSLPGLGWGVEGAWWAMTVDVIVRCLLVASRFVQGGWKRIEV